MVNGPKGAWFMEEGKIERTRSIQYRQIFFFFFGGGGGGVEIWKEGL